MIKLLQKFKKLSTKLSLTSSNNTWLCFNLATISPLLSAGLGSAIQFAFQKSEYYIYFPVTKTTDLST